ncbi:MAG: hypothetical protein ACP5VS_17430, partial [Desulfomonilaceae bacterium]
MFPHFPERKSCKSRLRILFNTNSIILAIAVIFFCSWESTIYAQPVPKNGAKDLQESFRAVAKNVRPAVVNVSSVRILQAQGPGPELDPFFENHPFREFFGDDFFKRFFGATPGGGKMRQQGLGSGFFQHVKTGDIMSRATNDLYAVREFIGSGIIIIVDSA